MPPKGTPTQETQADPPPPPSSQRKRQKDSEGEAIPLHGKPPTHENPNPQDTPDQTRPQHTPFRLPAPAFDEATLAASRKRATSAGSQMSDGAALEAHTKEALEREERRKQSEREKKKREKDAEKTKLEKEKKEMRAKDLRDQREAAEANAPPPPQNPKDPTPDDEADSFDRQTPPPDENEEKAKRNLAILQGLEESDRIRASDAHTLPIVYPREEDFPLIHAAHANSHVDNLDRVQFKEWLSAPGAGMLIHVMFQNSWDADRVPILVNLVRNVIQEHYGITDFHVAPGQPEADPMKNDFAPHAFAILNIPEEVAQSLIAQRCLANKKIAFIIYPQDYTAPTTYLGTIGGLVGLQVPGSMVNLAEVFKEKWRESKVWGVLAEYAQSKRDPEEDDSMGNKDLDSSEVEEILKTVVFHRVEAKAYGGVDASSLNIYISLDSPTAQQWNALVDAVSRVQYNSNIHGYGRHGPGWTCIQCRGIDHPAGMCPYLTEVPNWREITGLAINTLDEWEAHTFPDAPPRAYGPKSRGGSNRRGRGGHSGDGGYEGGRGAPRRGNRAAPRGYRGYRG